MVSDKVFSKRMKESGDVHAYSKGYKDALKDMDAGFVKRGRKL